MKAVKGRRWTEEEEEEVKEIYGAAIDKMRIPEGGELTAGMQQSRENNGLIHLRSREAIRKRLQALVVERCELYNAQRGFC